jgi:hypothetical protein
VNPGKEEVIPGGPSGLLLSRDLIFTSKITGTARALGYRFLTAGSVDQATTVIEQMRPRLIFADLASGDLTAPPALLALRRIAGPEAVFIAFGSHVDPASLDAARAAGCQEAMPRSRFVAELPELIRAHLGDSKD